MNAEERAREVKAATSSDWSRRAGGHKLDKVKGEQKLTVTREPEFLYDKDGNVVGVDAWVHLFDANGRELKIDPHRRIINPPTVPRSGVAREETGEVDQSGRAAKRKLLTPDPTAAFYEAVWDSVIGVPNEKGWRTRGTVTTVYSGAIGNDVYTWSSDTSYSAAREGTGGTLSVLTGSEFSTGQRLNEGGFYAAYQGLNSFDTSSISDGDIVSSVVLDLWLHDDQSATDFVVEARSHSWGPTATGADFVAGSSLSSLSLLASLASSGIGAIDAYKTFSSEAAFSSVTNMKTGIVYIMLSSSRQRIGNTPSGDEYLDFSGSSTLGTTEDPKLTITHAAPKAMVARSQPNRIWRLY